MNKIILGFPLQQQMTAVNNGSSKMAKKMGKVAKQFSFLGSQIANTHTKKGHKQGKIAKIKK